MLDTDNALQISALVYFLVSIMTCISQYLMRVLSKAWASVPNAPHWSTPLLNVIEIQVGAEALGTLPEAKTEAGGGAVRTRRATIFKQVIVSGAPLVFDGIAASAAVATPHKVHVTQQAASQQPAAQPFKPALKIDFGLDGFQKFILSTSLVLCSPNFSRGLELVGLWLTEPLSLTIGLRHWSTEIRSPKS